MAHPIDKVFPDCANGAVEALKSMSEGIDFTGCFAKPDPCVSGVWLVATPNMHCDWIVYLKGYLEPFSNIREFNDFEDVNWRGNHVNS